MIPPIIFQWDGDALIPANRFKSVCDKHFVVGSTYRMVEEKPHSTANRNHFFAAIHDAWLNLPENLTELYPNEEALRKRALIAAGYADQRSIVCASHAEAVRICAFLKGVVDYALVTISGSCVTMLTAKSQSKRSMGHDEFTASKAAVLDIISELVGIEPEKLRANAGTHA